MLWGQAMRLLSQAREAELEKEQQRIRKEKEKEIALLSALHEKAQDYRAEQVSTACFSLPHFCPLSLFLSTACCPLSLVSCLLSSVHCP